MTPDRKRTAALAAEGVVVEDPSSTLVGPDVVVEPGAVLRPFTILEGRTVVRARASVGPFVRLVDMEVGEGATVLDHCLLRESVVEAGASVGPFAHLRPGSRVGREAKVGNFVELKKTHLGDGSKAQHLSYLGDATIGTGVNIGAGTITCNYDGHDEEPDADRGGRLRRERLDPRRAGHDRRGRLRRRGQHDHRGRPEGLPRARACAPGHEAGLGEGAPRTPARRPQAGLDAGGATPRLEPFVRSFVRSLGPVPHGPRERRRRRRLPRTRPVKRGHPIMCGIVGYVGGQNAVPVILDGLRRLEYRGYDSAGIAVVKDGVVVRRRSAGKLQNLAASLAQDPLAGDWGLGHTRWATHGRPTEENAHPHQDCSGKIVVVHNGIIENHLELKTRLAAEGHRFVTQTDTEVVAHLVESLYAGSLEEAVRARAPPGPGRLRARASCTATSRTASWPRAWGRRS